MIRVALDTNALYTTTAGTARYVRGLRDALSHVAADLDVFELAWPVENFSYEQPLRSLKTVYRELVWTRFVGPRILQRGAPDVLHVTAQIAVPAPAAKRVVTLHDLAVIRHPERFRTWQRAQARRALAKLAAADRVICISRFTADEAMNLLDLPASKIAVVHNGCDFQSGDLKIVERAPAIDIPAKFFLFVGSLEPGKNLALLRQAYDIAEERKLDLPPLVIVGARWLGVADEGKPPANWAYLGRQPDEVLAYLYRRALALVFPSAYEGFGLPVAEAMTLGCPVICSALASLPEVAGDAALYAELNAASYLDVMVDLTRDDMAREQLRTRGINQARKFSWQKCASETADVYRSLVAGC
jgi:glycosyltransferase involved in cell wall biosynthesis